MRVGAPARRLGQVEHGDHLQRGRNGGHAKHETPRQRRVREPKVQHVRQRLRMQQSEQAQGEAAAAAARDGVASGRRTHRANPNFDGVHDDHHRANAVRSTLRNVHRPHNGRQPDRNPLRARSAGWPLSAWLAAKPQERARHAP